MKNTRRSFLKSGLLAGVGSTVIGASCTPDNDKAPKSTSTDYSALDDALHQPVLKKEFFPDPVIIES